MVTDYRLKELVSPSRRGKILLPMIAHSPALERGLWAIEKDVIDEALRITTAAVSTGDAATMIDSDWIEAVLGYVKRRGPNLQKLFADEGKRHTAAFTAGAKRALGVDLSAIVRDADLDDYVVRASERASGLITNMSTELAHKVAEATRTSVIRGGSASSLSEVIAQITEVSKSRAKLIASDQTGKVTSDITRIRHIQAGVTTYIWRTSHDERVRARHRELDGRTYSYDEQTGAEEGLPPGQPIRCRCIAQGIVE